MLLPDWVVTSLDDGGTESFKGRRFPNVGVC